MYSGYTHRAGSHALFWEAIRQNAQANACRHDGHRQSSHFPDSTAGKPNIFLTFRGALPE
jgi:hypothetical protein